MYGSLQEPNIPTMRAHFEAQGSLLVLRLLERKPRPNNAVSVRGRIRRFSSNARRRLMRFMARLRMKGVRATFITLTFKGYPSNEVAKLALHAFLQRIARNFPEASAVWRMEYQKRGSVHFHLLCFNLPYWHWEEILKAWKACSRQRVARIDVQLVRSRRGVMRYVSKYIAKVETKGANAFFIQVPYLHGHRKWRKGRFWGYHNKKHLPLGQKLEGVLVDDKLIKRLSNAAWEIIGSETRYNSISFNLFTDHAASLWTRYIGLGGLTIDEWRNSQQVTSREYRDYAYMDKHFSERELVNDYVKPKVSLSRGRAAILLAPCTKNWASRQFRTERAPSALATFPQLC